MTFTIVDTGESVRIFRPPFLLSKFAIQELAVKIEIFFFNDCHPMKELVVGIGFEKAKYYSYCMAFQKEHICAIDRRIPLQTSEEYENIYLSQLHGLHVVEKREDHEESLTNELENAVPKRKKILTPRIQAIDSSSPTLQAQGSKTCPPLLYFRRESKNITPSDLDSMLKILFPAIFPLWGECCKVNPYYYYPIAGSSKEFHDIWSIYKRKSVSFIWSKNISLAARIYWRLKSPIPLSQIISWSTNPAIQLCDIRPYPYADKVVAALGSASHFSPLLSKDVFQKTSSRDHWKDMILSLQGQGHLTDQALYCRYCGRPFPLSQVSGSNLASHYKRCPLKPLRNDLSTILQTSSSNSRLNFPRELWRDVEFRRFWLAPVFFSSQKPLISKKESIDIWWIWENLPKKPLATLPRFGLLEKSDFIPIGVLFSKVTSCGNCLQIRYSSYLLKKCLHDQYTKHACIHRKKASIKNAA